jgi:hypothetical protein
MSAVGALLTIHDVLFLSSLYGMESDRRMIMDHHWKKFGRQRQYVMCGNVPDTRPLTIRVWST